MFYYCFISSVVQAFLTKLEYQSSKGCSHRERNTKSFQTHQLGDHATQLDLAIRVLAKNFARLKPLCLLPDLIEYIKVHVVHNEQTNVMKLCSSEDFDDWAKIKLIGSPISPSSVTAGKTSKDRIFQVYQTESKTILESLQLAFQLPCEKITASALTSKRESCFGMSLGINPENGDEMLNIDEGYTMFTSLVDEVEDCFRQIFDILMDLMVLFHKSPTDYKLFENKTILADNLYQDIYDYLIYYLDTIIPEFLESGKKALSEEMINEVTSKIQECRSKIEHMEVTLNRSDVHIFFTFFKKIQIGATTLMTYPYDLFYHNVTGERRNFASFSKLISSDFMAFIRKFTCQVLFTHKQMPGSLSDLFSAIKDDHQPPLEFFRRTGNAAWVLGLFD